MAETPPPLSVLVVDDDALNRLLLRAMVETFGATVVEADDARAALDRLAAQPFDLAMVDIHMPGGMSGVELLASLRASAGPNRDLRVVAVTGDTGPGSPDYGAAGFDGCLAKPISLASVGNALQPSETGHRGAAVVSRRQPRGVA